MESNQYEPPYLLVRLPVLREEEVEDVLLPRLGIVAALVVHEEAVSILRRRLSDVGVLDLLHKQIWTTVGR